jgi:hypothetical protein
VLLFLKRWQIYTLGFGITTPFDHL